LREEEKEHMGEENRLDSGSSLQTARERRSVWLALEQFLFLCWIVVDAALGALSRGVVEDC
jgi:hypothetical protein